MLYKNMKIKLNSIEKLIEVKENRKQNKKDLFYKLAANVVTIILGLPGAQKVTEVVSSWNYFEISENKFWVLNLFLKLINNLIKQANSNNTLFTLTVYSLIIFIVLIIPNFLGWFIFRNKDKNMVSYDQSNPKGKKKFVWPNFRKESKD